MKKLIFLFAVLIGLGANAQRATTIALAAGDTIVNTGTASKVILATGGYSGIAVQVLLTKLSGTGAGTVQMQGSLDGTNYSNIGSSYTITNVASQSTIFYITAPLPVYIKLLSTGSGTESVVQTVSYVFRKYDRSY